MSIIRALLLSALFCTLGAVLLVQISSKKLYRSALLAEKRAALLSGELEAFSRLPQMRAAPFLAAFREDRRQLDLLCSAFLNKNNASILAVIGAGKAAYIYPQTAVLADTFFSHENFAYDNRHRMLFIRRNTDTAIAGQNYYLVCAAGMETSLLCDVISQEKLSEFLKYRVLQEGMLFLLSDNLSFFLLPRYLRAGLSYSPGRARLAYLAEISFPSWMFFLCLISGFLLIKPAEALWAGAVFKTAAVYSFLITEKPGTGISVPVQNDIKILPGRMTAKTDDDIYRPGQTPKTLKIPARLKKEFTGEKIRVLPAGENSLVIQNAGWQDADFEYPPPADTAAAPAPKAVPLVSGSRKKILQKYNDSDFDQVKTA